MPLSGCDAKATWVFDAILESTAFFIVMEEVVIERTCRVNHANLCIGLRFLRVQSLYKGRTPISADGRLTICNSRIAREFTAKQAQKIRGCIGVCAGSVYLTVGPPEPVHIQKSHYTRGCS